MDFAQIFDMLLHVDQVLGTVIQQYGDWVYMILFLIIFSETGLVVFPFLPGDSLIFIAGAFCASGDMDPWLLSSLLTVGAVLGNMVNYWVGSLVGHKVYTHNYRWIDKDALQKTHAFFEKHGGKTIVLCRFVPVIRTFAPFVAGMSGMPFVRFQLFNIGGALLWCVGLIWAGYFFGNIAFIRDHLSTIAVIGVSAAVVPVALGILIKMIKRMYLKYKA